MNQRHQTIMQPLQKHAAGAPGDSLWVAAIATPIGGGGEKLVSERTAPNLLV